jgi:hypothetical protein
MARIVVSILALGAAVMAATVFGTIVHDGFGIARATIRADALVGVALIGSALATRALLNRDK